MGKKKQFINKKAAASFHIIHRTNAPDASADAASSLSELSLSSLTSSSVPPNTANQSASSSSAYYFQPASSSTAIPAGFPVDLLVDHNSERELALYRRERRTARERERDSRDPTLLPHEYDYSAHLREIGGGRFIAAAGAAEYETGASKRERQQREQRQQQQGDVRNQQPVAEDELDREVDWERVRQAEMEGRKRRRKGAGGTALAQIPVDVQLALEYEERSAAGNGLEGQFDELEDDFVLQAMKGTGDTEDEGEDGEEEKDGATEEDEEDNMLAEIQQYEMHELAEGEEDDDGEGAGVDWEAEGQEDELDEAEEIKSGDDQKLMMPQRQTVAGQRTAQTHSSSQREMAPEREDEDADEGSVGKDRQRDEVESFRDEEEEHEDEVHPLPSRLLDADFDRLLSEQYGDDDIGGLNDVEDSLVSGQLSIDAFTDSLDAFLSRQSLPVSEGGSSLELPSAERETIKRRMGRRLRAMAAEEGQEAGIEQWMSDVYKQVMEDGWDVESVISTYSNTDNHPTAIREQGSRAAVLQAAKRKEQAQAALAAAITSAVQPTQHHQHEDEESEQYGADEQDGASRNLGIPRPRGESAEEKRARKAAWKAEKRESRQRKKQLRTLYASIEHTKQMQHAKMSVDNPAGRQLI